MLSIVDAPQMIDLDFDQVLSVLQRWLGDAVNVGVSVTARPVQVASLRGLLGATRDVLDPYDEEEWEFTVGEHGTIGLHRDCFSGANLFPESGRLIVLMVDDDEQPAAAAVTEVHVVGPAGPHQLKDDET